MIDSMQWTKMQEVEQLIPETRLHLRGPTH